MTMLSVQYRMHSKISKFISHYFYQGQLKDGADLDRHVLQTPGFRGIVHEGCCIRPPQANIVLLKGKAD